MGVERSQTRLLRKRVSRGGVSGPWHPFSRLEAVGAQKGASSPAPTRRGAVSLVTITAGECWQGQQGDCAKRVKATWVRLAVLELEGYGAHAASIPSPWEAAWGERPM